MPPITNCDFVMEPRGEGRRGTGAGRDFLLGLGEEPVQRPEAAAVGSCEGERMCSQLGPASTHPPNTRTHTHSPALTHIGRGMLAVIAPVEPSGVMYIAVRDTSCNMASPSLGRKNSLLQITKMPSSKTPREDFPGGPVVRALRFHCRGRRFNP